eukprot:Hpha_TRINITY_DN15828_c0_g5::TRINITY_DN15828_c0_g5_i1::g.188168::m.188168
MPSRAGAYSDVTAAAYASSSRVALKPLQQPSRRRDLPKRSSEDRPRLRASESGPAAAACVATLRNARTPAARLRALGAIRASAVQIRPADWLSSGFCEAVCGLLVGDGRPPSAAVCMAAAEATTEALKGDGALRCFFRLAHRLLQTAAPTVCALLHVLLLIVSITGSTSVLLACEPLPVLCELLSSTQGEDTPKAPYLQLAENGSKNELGASPSAADLSPMLGGSTEWSPGSRRLRQRDRASSSIPASPRALTVLGSVVKIPRLRLGDGAFPLGLPEAPSQQLLHGSVPADKAMRLVTGSGRPALSNCQLSTNDVVKGFGVDNGGGKYQATLMHLAHKLGRLYATKDLPRMLAQRRLIGGIVRSPRRKSGQQSGLSPQPLSLAPQMSRRSVISRCSTVEERDELGKWYEAHCCRSRNGNAEQAALRVLAAALLAAIARHSPVAVSTCAPSLWRGIRAAVDPPLASMEAAGQMSQQLEHALHSCASGAENKALPPFRGDDPVLWEWAALAKLDSKNPSPYRSRWEDHISSDSLRVLADYLEVAKGTARVLPLRAAEACSEPLVHLLRSCAASDAFSPASIARALELLRVFAVFLDSHTPAPALNSFLWSLFVCDSQIRGWLREFTRVALAHPSAPPPDAWAAAFAEVELELNIASTAAAATIVADFWASLFHFLGVCSRRGVPQHSGAGTTSPVDWRRDKIGGELGTYLGRLGFLYSPVDGCVLSWLAHEPVFEHPELKAALLEATAALSELPNSPLLRASVCASYLRLHFLTLLQLYQHDAILADQSHARLASLHTQCIMRLVKTNSGFVRGRATQLGILEFVLEEIGLEAGAEAKRERLLRDRVQHQGMFSDEELKRRVTWKRPGSGLPGSGRLGKKSEVISEMGDPGAAPLWTTETEVMEDRWREKTQGEQAAGTRLPPKVPTLRLSNSPALSCAADVGSAKGQGPPATPDRPTCQSGRGGAASDSMSGSRMRPKIPSLRLSGAIPPALWGTSEPATPGFTLQPLSPLSASAKTLPFPGDFPVAALPPQPSAQSQRRAVTPGVTPPSLPNVPTLPLYKARIVDAPLNSGLRTPQDGLGSGDNVARRLPFGAPAGAAGMPSPLVLALTGSIEPQNTAPLSPIDHGPSARDHDVLASSAAFLFRERAARALYQDRDLHKSLVLLALILVVDPSAQCTVDQSRIGSVGEALLCLAAHLNHPDNAHLVNDLLEALPACGEPLSGKVHVLLRMLVVSLSSAGVYKAIRKLGHGAFGSVQLCEFEECHCPSKVAVKYVPASRETAVDVFAEILAMRQCSLGAPPVLDWGCDGRAFYIVTPCYPVSLRHWRIETLPGDACSAHLVLLLRTFSSVVECVQLAHALGVVHNDLKCDNILLHWEPSRLVPVATLCDWGESVYSGEAERIACRARGTEHARPPEVLMAHSGNRDYDRRRARAKASQTAAADVWALGCLLYEALTGELLFYDEMFPRFYQRVTDPAEPLLTESDTARLPADKGVVDLLLLALNRNPERRPGAHDILKHCRALVDTLPEDPRPPPPPPAPWASATPSSCQPLKPEEVRGALDLGSTEAVAGSGQVATLCPGVLLGFASGAEAADLGVRLVVVGEGQQQQQQQAQDYTAQWLPLEAQLRAINHRPAAKFARGTTDAGARMRRCWQSALGQAARVVAEGGKVLVLGGRGAVLFGAAFLARWHGLDPHEASAVATSASRRIGACHPGDPTSLPQLSLRCCRLVRALQIPNEAPAPREAVGDRFRCACGVCVYGVSLPHEAPELRTIGWWAECGRRMQRLWDTPLTTVTISVPAGDAVLSPCAVSGVESPLAPKEGLPSEEAVFCCPRCSYITHTRSAGGGVTLHATVSERAACLGEETVKSHVDPLKLVPAVPERAERVESLLSAGVVLDLRVSQFRLRAASSGSLSSSTYSGRASPHS